MHIWQLADKFKIYAVSFDGEWVVYHSGSGETHRLSFFSSHIFSLFWLEHLQLDIDQITVLLFKALTTQVNTDQIQLVLDNLLKLNLIEKI